jgi:hypothetical protein
LLEEIELGISNLDKVGEDGQVEVADKGNGSRRGVAEFDMYADVYMGMSYEVDGRSCDSQ